MSKRQHLTDQLRTRVTRGYYAIKDLPSERQLAAESGVAYMTARRAVQQLIEDGLECAGQTGVWKSIGWEMRKLVPCKSRFCGRVTDRITPMFTEWLLSAQWPRETERCTSLSFCTGMIRWSMMR